MGPTEICPREPAREAVTECEGERAGVQEAGREDAARREGREALQAKLSCKYRQLLHFLHESLAKETAETRRLAEPPHTPEGPKSWSNGSAGAQGSEKTGCADEAEEHPGSCAGTVPLRTPDSRFAETWAMLGHAEDEATTAEKKDRRAQESGALDALPVFAPVGACTVKQEALTQEFALRAQLGSPLLEEGKEQKKDFHFEGKQLTNG
ncbi:hypothetical protein NCLIV_057430 [Neospora caninum Liverpool]|uniref:Uncharacterized protein n=1 Tax=Neospora caninum (strain Liverpool) TaxID=572307 RepID=F0VNM4_NEOCL|nr:hypothetical protein NCLIV_057430 [Neospora caninum Liverpool]CBZ55320.1 hypothetical protein NCLIV_057430 [Neospora caninum Liverpool]|eukprot:XP_003885348.1 hypothetical protein NCLIV_057430 [Neospora caninum Liverpool]